jgi:hypothetical protein
MLEKFLNWISKHLDKHIQRSGAWECFFCYRMFSGDHPRVNAYKDGKPVYQCEECRIRMELEPTPTVPFSDSQG